MNPPTNIAPETQLTDITGLRQCGIFPAGKEPSIRTLRSWTKLRRIPHHRVGHSFTLTLPKWPTTSARS